MQTIQWMVSLEWWWMVKNRCLRYVILHMGIQHSMSFFDALTGLFTGIPRIMYFYFFLSLRYILGSTTSLWQSTANVLWIAFKERVWCPLIVNVPGSTSWRRPLKYWQVNDKWLSSQMMVTRACTVLVFMGRHLTLGQNPVPLVNMARMKGNLLNSSPETYSLLNIIATEAKLPHIYPTNPFSQCKVGKLRKKPPRPAAKSSVKSPELWWTKSGISRHGARFQTSNCGASESLWGPNSGWKTRQSSSVPTASYPAVDDPNFY